MILTDDLFSRRRPMDYPSTSLGYVATQIVRSQWFEGSFPFVGERQFSLLINEFLETTQ
jgi:hypothetical protein